MAINLYHKQVNKIVDYLAGQGKKIIKDASTSKETNNRKKNQLDAYGWAVYYKGKEQKRGYLTPGKTASEKHNAWKAKGIPSGFGRADIDGYLNGYKPKSNGFQLIVVNAVFYTTIQEQGGGKLKHRYRIITQEFSNMEAAGSQFKGATVTLL